MFYSFLYIILDLDIFYLDIWCVSLRGNVKVLGYKGFFFLLNAEYMRHVFKLKKNRLNNCEFNIDPNHRDYVVVFSP